jgi:two-component system, sensor histidine kinase LadS
MGQPLDIGWLRLGAALMAAFVGFIVGAPAEAQSLHRLQEYCRVATPNDAPLAAALPRLERCAAPAPKAVNGTVWIDYRIPATRLEPQKTWRLALDNHRSKMVDVWLLGAGGRAQHLRYDPNAPDREWVAGNYQSLLITPEFEVRALVLRLTDAQTHSYVRSPIIARAKRFAPIERNNAALYGMGVGMLALTILFHMSLFFAMRRRFQLIYCAHVALLLIYALCYSGIIRILAPSLGATAVSNLLSFTMCAATGTGMAFLIDFLGSALGPRVRRWAQAGGAASLLAALVMIAAPPSLSHAAYLVANAVAVHAILLTSGILAVACWQRKPMAGIITAGWLMPIAVSLMYPLRTAGLVGMDGIPDGLMMIASTVECLILSLPVANRIRRLRLDHERAHERHLVLERQAQTDALTGLANRRGLGEAMTRADAAHAEPVLLALLVIDIDHFKRVNDRYGHGTGDLILRHVAAHVARVAGPGAIVARHGGEEFVVALRGYDLARAGTIAERMRASIGPSFEAADDLPPVTISIGVAAGTSDEFQDLLEDADCALYRAKNEGRNRVMLADGPLVYAAAA